MAHDTVIVTERPSGESLPLAAFRDRLSTHLTGGGRLLTLFATPAPGAEGVGTHAELLEAGRGLAHLAARLPAGDPFPSLTPAHPQLHCFERELHEQHGIPVPGHPWLKTIRFEGRNLGQTHDYPFYHLAGKEVHEVAVGPIHAGVIEPGHFRFMCHGETVHHLEIHLGYQHRGAEALLAGSPLGRLGPLVESVAGDTAIAHAVAFCRAWEALCGVEVSSEVEAVRGLALELERVAMHLVGLGGLATDVAFLPGSATYGRLRTAVINLTMRLCGSRFGRGWFRPGQLRFRFGPAQREDVLKTLADVRRDIALINDLFGKSRSVRHRLAGTGVVPTPLARELGLVGLAGRASGLPCDLRTELGGVAYAVAPVPLVTEAGGDCLARAVVRMREIDESIAWAIRVAEVLPVVAGEPPLTARPRGGALAVSVEEGWRGEVVHALETDAEGKVARYKVQDPSLRNWFGLAQAVRGNAVYDFPICNKSFDLSYCGNDL